MANDPIIKAEHLTFCYPDEPAGHPPVLDDISLEIEAGSFVAILGHNGSGKSTFAKHINALLTPTAGKLWVDGLDTGDPEVFAFSRTGGGERLLFALNLSGALKQEARVAWRGRAPLQELLNTDEQRFGGAGRANGPLAPA